jgi:hypothetical protein
MGHSVTNEYFLNEEDKPIIRAFNERCSNPDFKLQLHLQPEPWIGNLKRAKVIFLALNPGYGTGKEITDDQVHLNNQFLDILNRHKLAPEQLEYPYYYLDPQPEFERFPGMTWCRRIFGKLIDAVPGGDKSLSNKIACIQYHGYHSKRYKRVTPEILPSQYPSFKAVESAIDSNKTIVIMRSRKIWYSTIPKLNDIDNRVMKLKNPRNPTISPGNLGEDNFKTLVQILSC